ncbi:hypothetical protein Emed_002910 [Eimeria media]
MPLFLDGFFYRAAAVGGAATACGLAIVPLLSHYSTLLQQRGRSSSSSSSSSSSKAVVGQPHTEPLTLACRIMLMVPVYALTSLLAFLFCSPLASLSAPAVSSESPAAAAAASGPGGAAAAAAAAAATALQQGSGGWKGLWLRGVREAYEVYALYAFLELMISMLGGEQQAVNQLHLKVLSACMQQEGFFFVALISNVSAFVSRNIQLHRTQQQQQQHNTSKFTTSNLAIERRCSNSSKQSLGLRWLAGLFLPDDREAAAAAAARLQDWLICFEMIPCAAPCDNLKCLGSSQPADECSLLLQRGDIGYSAPHSSSAAAAAEDVDFGSSAESGSTTDSSSSSSSSKLKKPLKQLMSGVQQLLLSDAVLTDATHAVFGSQQQQREFRLEARPAAAVPP